MMHFLHALLLFLVITPYIGMAFLVADSVWNRKSFLKEWPSYLTAFLMILVSHVALILLITGAFA